MHGSLSRALGSAVATLWLLGCSTMDVESEIQVPSNQQHRITQRVTQTMLLALPGDHVFNIHLKNSRQNPGPEGTARGQADARPEGDASCLVDTANGGTAAAEFRLGHRLENQTAQSLTATIETQCRIDCRIQASHPPQPETLADVALHLIVLDGSKKTLCDVPLKNLTSDSGLSESATTERQTVQLPLEPNQTYDVFLLGRAQARTAPSQQAQIRMDLRELKMRIRAQPVKAQTQPTASLVQ